MKKFVYIIYCLFILLTNTTFNTNKYENKVAPILPKLENIIKQEERVYAIDELFFLACIEYDLDFKMVYAIARLETGNFTSKLCKNKNNFGGMYNGKEWKSFPTVEDGIWAMCKMLRLYYIDRGLTTVDLISKKYCPATAEDWARKVKSIMREL